MIRVQRGIEHPRAAHGGRVAREKRMPARRARQPVLVPEHPHVADPAHRSGPPAVRRASTGGRRKRRSVAGRGTGYVRHDRHRKLVEHLSVVAARGVEDCRAHGHDREHRLSEDKRGREAARERPAEPDHRGRKRAYVCDRVDQLRAAWVQRVKVRHSLAPVLQ